MKLPVHLSIIGASALLFISAPQIHAADGDNTGDKKEEVGDKKADDKGGKRKHHKKGDDGKKTDGKADDKTIDPSK